MIHEKTCVSLTSKGRQEARRIYATDYHGAMRSLGVGEKSLEEKYLTLNVCGHILETLSDSLGDHTSSSYPLAVLMHEAVDDGEFPSRSPDYLDIREQTADAKYGVWVLQRLGLIRISKAKHCSFERRPGPEGANARPKGGYQ